MRTFSKASFYLFLVALACYLAFWLHSLFVAMTIPAWLSAIFAVLVTLVIVLFTWRSGDV